MREQKFLTFSFLIYLSSSFSAHKFLKKEICETKGPLGGLDECTFVDDSLTFKGRILRPVVKSEFIIAVYQIKDDQAKVLFKTPKLEWCSVVRKGQFNKFVALKLFLDFFGKDLSLIFQCPIPVGNISIIDKKIPQIKLFILPGIYRGSLSLKSWSLNDEITTLNISVLVQIDGII
ncbi:hypothetical protein PVAND_002230 [Polypedilum vanderplanki]|uniref:Uncharacterized protein n=1 Tax=Polypedilum vanderplanki TaxID=319348 RepID=A0A9J6BQM3_POLVA|nr:hypothetical protein PVAND_002230 [Polypedilum vanderplanki]